MSSDKVNLGDISDKLNVNLSRNTRKNSNYKFFPSKNNREPTEQDRSAVSSYSSILGGIVKKGANAVAGLFQNNNKVVKTSLGQRRPIRTVKEGGHSKSTSQPLKTNHQLSNNKETLLRCNVCNCVNPCNIEGCTFCMKEEIQIIDSDCEEFPSIEHTQRKPRMSNGQIPTASFYSKENTSFGNHSSSKLNASRSNISITEDDTEESVKYEIDYLYIGTYRFISRTYIRVASDKLVLFINSGKEGLNIDYKLVRNIFICEAKSDNSKYTYMKIDFCSEAVDAINAYISKFNDENGNFKFDSINGHEKYFIMKLKFLLPDEALKLKKRLRIYLQHNLKEESSIHSMFEQQRHYCLNLRSRKKQKTTDSRTKNQDRLKTAEIKSDIRNHFRDEPMEVDRVYSNIPSMTTRSFSSLFSDRSTTTTTVSTYERTPFKRKPPSTFGSIKSIDQDEDMEVSEVLKPKSNLPIKNIKNNKILYETIMGEQLVIFKSDLYCLNDGNFLNDKIIEFYLMYIKSNLIDHSIAEKTYIFSSFFFTKMLSLTKGPLSDEQFMENLYNLVKNWTKNVDIFQFDYLIVPIFRNYHWNLAIIVYPNKVLKEDLEVFLDCEDGEKSAIILLDSMGKDRMFNKYSKYLRNFLQKECVNKKSRSVEFNNEAMSHLDPIVPHQPNGYDCGIFVLHYVELFLKNPKAIIQKIRKDKTSLDRWFSAADLRGKRSEIFQILFNIYESNLMNNIKFESDEDLTMKSDEEIEIITNDDNKGLLSSDDE